MSRSTNAVCDFLFRPASARPLAALRIGLGLTLLFQALSLSSDLFDLYGSSGILQGTLSKMRSGPPLPSVAWLCEVFGSWGIAEDKVIVGVAGTFLASLIFLTIGFRTRFAALLAWFTHMLLFNGQMTSYGVDNFAHIFLFYLIWIPSGAAWSLDARLAGKTDEPTTGARLALRVLQIHLCLVYLYSGIAKGMGEQWWNGEAMWRSLMLPIYRQFDFAWLANFPLLAKLGCWTTLLVETAYPIFIWPRATRRLWVILAVALHLGITVFLGLGVFGIAMSIFTLAIFGISAEPVMTRSHAPSPVREGSSLVGTA